MTTHMSQVNNNRANTCPHGLPLGACPICNGMGGGSSSRKMDEPRRPGEMTYQECYAQWKQMQRAQAADKAAQEAMIKNAELAAQLQKQLAGLADKAVNVLNSIQNVLPKPAAKAFAVISNNILKPLLNIVKNFPEIIRNLPNAIETIKNELLKVQEKLSAIFGEVQNFIQKKISDSIKSLKKRLKSLLSTLSSDDDFEDEDEFDEQINVFKNIEIDNLKESIRKLITPKLKEYEIATDKNERPDAKV